MNIAVGEFGKDGLFISNLEAEGQVLGGILLNNQLFVEVADKLRPEHFSAEVNAEIYKVCADLIRQGKIASPVSVKPLLSFDKCGTQTPMKYMMGWLKNPASAIVIQDYAQQIIDMHLRRQLVQAADEIKYNAEQTSGPSVASVAEDASEKIAEIVNAAATEEEKPSELDEMTDACIAHLEDVRAGRVDECPKTGIPDLDKKIGGWNRGRLYVVGGRPGQGKTVFGTSQALRVTRQKKKDNKSFGALYVSLEVPYRDIWSRLVSCTLADTNWPIAYHSIQYGDELDDASYERVIATAHKVKAQPLRTIDDDTMTIARIEERIKETKRRWEKRGQTLDVVFIDYLGFVKASDRYKGFRVHEIAEISAGLVAIAKRHNIAVVALSQLSRAVEGRESKIPNLSDLRDSGAIEQDANSVIFLYRAAYYQALEADEGGIDPTDEQENEIILNVAKSRDGSTGLVHAYVDVANNMIRSKDR